VSNFIYVPKDESDFLVFQILKILVPQIVVLQIKRYL